MSTQSTLSPADTELAYRKLLDAYRGSLGATSLTVLELILLSAEPVAVVDLKRQLPLTRTHLGTTLVRLADRQLILHVTRGVYVRNPEALLHVMPAPAGTRRQRASRDEVALDVMEVLLLSHIPVSRGALVSAIKTAPGVMASALQYLLEHQMISEPMRSHYQVVCPTVPRQFTLKAEDPSLM